MLFACGLTGLGRFGLLNDRAFCGRKRQSGRIAQLVEQLTLNQRVPGSSPGAPTIHSRDSLDFPERRKFRRRVGRSCPANAGSRMHVHLARAIRVKSDLRIRQGGRPHEHDHADCAGRADQALYRRSVGRADIEADPRRHIARHGRTHTQLSRGRPGGHRPCRRGGARRLRQWSVAAHGRLQSARVICARSPSCCRSGSTTSPMHGRCRSARRSC